MSVRQLSFDEFNDFLAHQGGPEGECDVFNFIADRDDDVTEFWETGSVTLSVAGRKFVLSINIQEEE